MSRVTLKAVVLYLCLALTQVGACASAPVDDSQAKQRYILSSLKRKYFAPSNSRKVYTLKNCPFIGNVGTRIFLKSQSAPHLLRPLPRGNEPRRCFNSKSDAIKAGFFEFASGNLDLANAKFEENYGLPYPRIRSIYAIDAIHLDPGECSPNSTKKYRRTLQP